MKPSTDRNGNLIVFTIYIVLTFTGIWFHEPWRDEAQAWLLARDLSLPGLIHEMGYDGSPALWHMLLMPLAKAGLPYFSMQVLHWLIASTAVFLLIFYAPFEKGFRYLLAFNYFLVYEYSIIARSYALSVLLLFTLAMLFKSRKEKPLLFAFLIALLANTNTHSLFAAAALSLIFVFDYLKSGFRSLLKPKILASLVILAGGFLLFIFQLIPPADSWKPGLMNGTDWPWIFDAVGHALIPNYLSNPGMTLHFKHWTELFFLWCVFALIIHMIAKDRQMLFFYLFSIGGLFLIFTFKHSGYLRHFGFIFLYLVFVLWAGNYPALQKSLRSRIKSADRKSFPGLLVYALLIILFFTSAMNGIYSLGLDLRKSFSGAKEMAGIIETKYPSDKQILTYNIHTITAVVPYLEDKTWWDAGKQNTFTFIHWDNQYLPTRTLDQAVIYERLKNRSTVSGAKLVLLPYSADPAIMPDLQLIKAADQNITGDEKYFLYRFPD
jgi:hypothetical protein